MSTATIEPLAPRADRNCWWTASALAPPPRQLWDSLEQNLGKAIDLPSRKALQSRSGGASPAVLSFAIFEFFVVNQVVML